jgi:hypothetical protein
VKNKELAEKYIAAIEELSGNHMRLDHKVVLRAFGNWLDSDNQEVKQEDRVPKWARTKEWIAEDKFRHNKWYKVCAPRKENSPRRWEWDSISEGGRSLRCWEHNDTFFGVYEWELCYDDVPPEIKCDKCGQVIQ